MDKQLVKTSKFLSLILRHKPETIGLQLDKNGWATIDELVMLTKGQATPLTREFIETVVQTSDKQRFMLSEDGQRIRANQGHSLSVELDLAARQPPAFLYHGTATRFLNSILKTGLEKRQRQHVHLSADMDTANKVGVRHGKLVVLKIAAGDMHGRGHPFYLSANQVWLCDHVPPQFLTVLE